MKNALGYEIRNLCPANSALHHAHVEREAQATRPSAKRGQLTTLLGLHLCCRPEPDARWVDHDDADASLKVQ